MTQVPCEIIDLIIESITDTKHRYQAAVALRRLGIRDKLIPKIRFASMDFASKKGQIDLLEWWKSSGPGTYYTENAMHDASRNGHVDVLRWWKASGLELKIVDGMESASENGHVDVLEWWKASGLELACPEWALYRATWNGHNKVLEWWEASGLELKFCSLEFDAAVRCGHAEVLNWWTRFDNEWMKANEATFAIRSV